MNLDEVVGEIVESSRCRMIPLSLRASGPLPKVASCLTVPPHKTKIVIEVVTTFSSFRFPELSQPI
jgi:hypothetical protein